jgi:hypothetical protein
MIREKRLFAFADDLLLELHSLDELGHCLEAFKQMETTFNPRLNKKKTVIMSDNPKIINIEAYQGI